jgi:hypothetical protein
MIIDKLLLPIDDSICALCVGYIFKNVLMTGPISVSLS